jgi:hypothetical protein
VANTLAYYNTVTITIVDSFIEQATRPTVIKLFFCLHFEIRSLSFQPGKFSKPSLIIPRQLTSLTSS